MTPDRVEALLAASRPEPAPPELRRRVLEAVRARTRPSPPKTLWTGRLAVTTAALLLLGTLAWLLGAPPTSPTQEGRSFEEKRLDVLPPEGSIVGRVLWSADGLHWGYILKQGKTMAAVVDGRKGESAHEVSQLCFGAGGRYAYLASAQPQGPQALVVDGLRREGFDAVNLPTWSPDGRTLAFAAQKDKKWRLVVGETAGEAFDHIQAVVWSPDGKTLAYSARIQRDQFLVVDGRKGEIFDSVHSPVFSPDGRSLAYVAEEGDYHLVVDGRKSPAYKAISPPVFHGAVLVYTAWGKEGFLAIGESRVPFKFDADPPVFSQDGRTFAFVSRDTVNKHWVTVGRRKGEGWDLTEHEAFGGIDELGLSPDGRRIVYIITKGNRQHLVVDGQPGKKFSRIHRLRLGPDGTPAYVAVIYGKSFVVAGEAQAEEVDAVLDGPVFSADGRKVAYVALKGGELWAKTLDVK